MGLAKNQAYHRIERFDVESDVYFKNRQSC